MFWKQLLAPSLSLPPSSLSASDDVPRADEVRTLVKDVWDMRQAKLRKGVDQMISQQETFAKVPTSTSVMHTLCSRLPVTTTELWHVYLSSQHLWL